MRWHRLVIVTGGLFAAGIVAAGCAHRTTELALTTYDQTEDQRAIAEFYNREAVKLRQMAEEMSDRAAVYERLFGPDSDWVKGTRLLAQSYEEAAQEHERKAGKHLGLLGGRLSSGFVWPDAR